MRKMNVILIIEDEPLWVDIISNIIKTKGVHIIHANSFAQACNKIKEFNKDIILLITDIRLDTNNNRNIDGIHIIEKMIMENLITEFMIISYFINDAIKEFVYKNNIKFYLKSEINLMKLAKDIEITIKNKMNSSRQKNNNYKLKFSYELV